LRSDGGGKGSNCCFGIGIYAQPPREAARHSLVTA
jgi:hypothetical protein